MLLMFLIDLRSFPLLFSALLLLQAHPPPPLSLSSLDQKSLQQLIPCLQGDPRAFPYQMGYFKLCSMLLIFPTLVFLSVAQNNHHREASWRRCEQMSESPRLAPVSDAKRWLCVKMISFISFIVRHKTSQLKLL